MSIRIMPWFIGIVGCLALGWGAKLMAEPPMSPGALAARQRVKNMVIDAMADGYISPGERAVILEKAQRVLQLQEWEGLQRTLDRLSAHMNSERIDNGGYLPPQRVSRYTDRYASQGFLAGRLFSSSPYYEGPPMVQRPLIGNMVRNVPRRLPYIERPEWNGSRLRQIVAQFPRLNDLDPELPLFLPSTNQTKYVVRTVPPPKVRQAEVSSKRYSASGASPSLPRSQKVSSKDAIPGVETPVAFTPLPYEDKDFPGPGSSTSARGPQPRKPDYRMSRTTYLESLRNR
jgi:hypothetical protein